MSLIDKYPYGKAPFALLVIAIVSVGLRVATARRHGERPDLVIATYSDAHYDAYRKADGDGVIDHYMLDLRSDGARGLNALMLGFRSGDLGLGSAGGWVIAVITFTISLIQIRIARIAED